MVSFPADRLSGPSPTIDQSHVFHSRHRKHHHDNNDDNNNNQVWFKNNNNDNKKVCLEHMAYPAQACRGEEMHFTCNYRDASDASAVSTSQTESSAHHAIHPMRNRTLWLKLHSPFAHITVIKKKKKRLIQIISLIRC